MKIAVVGSRTFTDYKLLEETLTDYLTDNAYNGVIISGGAKGADKLAERFADEMGLEKLIFHADWNAYGKRAGFIRNVDIIKNADIVFAFHQNNSKGTQHSIDLAKQWNKELYIIEV